MLGTLYFMTGKMGAGKSTFAERYAREHSVALISEDAWLAALYPDEIRNFSDFLDRHKRLLSVMQPHIQSLLQVGTSVILDFPANTVAARQGFKQLAEAVGANHQLFHLDVADELCLSRLETRRTEQPERAHFDTPEVFEQVTALFEEPTSDEALNVTVVTHTG
ncbi:AAA family ATPase [Saccharospirillum salsuginis]|nr:ATP-binding protein [Saccharospirillum salsuginis]